MLDPELDQLLPVAEELVRKHLADKPSARKPDIVLALRPCVKPVYGWIGNRIADAKANYLIKLLQKRGILRHALFSTARRYCILAPFLRCQHTRYHTKPTT
jgi:hypothetical protein